MVEPDPPEDRVDVKRWQGHFATGKVRNARVGGGFESELYTAGLLIRREFQPMGAQGNPCYFRFSSERTASEYFKRAYLFRPIAKLFRRGRESFRRKHRGPRRDADLVFEVVNGDVMGGMKDDPRFWDSARRSRIRSQSDHEHLELTGCLRGAWLARRMRKQSRHSDRKR